MNCYPVILNLEKQKVLVIGGGPVAERKIKTLLDCGGKLTVISPEVSPEIKRLTYAEGIMWLDREYKDGDLNGFSMVIAATDDHETNSKIAREALQKGVLVNVVDDPSNSSCLMPAFFRRGNMIVAISTSGASPALASKLKERLSYEIGPEWSDLTQIVGEVRQELKNRGETMTDLDWEKALDIDDLLTLIKSGRKDEAKHSLLKRLVSGSL